MVYRYMIETNMFLNKSVMGYAHQYYRGYRKEGNPDFVNILKNTFGNEDIILLNEAMDQVVSILKEDIPQLMFSHRWKTCLLVVVPRAKSDESYLKSQLMFKEAVSKASFKIRGAIDGTDCIVRVKDTMTTHLKNAPSIKNDGPKPYPGITMKTCIFDTTTLNGQNVILIDDIYTKNVNIDEDCLQALLKNGAKRVIFYAIGYTRRNL